jgi:quercetin dioxygenase-like cupin family protein
MRIITRKSIALTGASLLALSAGTALATAPSGETVTPLARGALVKPANANVKVAGGRVKVQTKGALDVLMLQLTLAPGGSGGWHKHAGPAFTVVKQGTLTIFDAKCKRHDIPAGGAFFNPGTTPHEDENKGTTPVVFNVTFLIPHGAASPRIDQPAPPGCNA